MHLSKSTVLIVALLLLPLHGTLLAAADVYKSVDANGHVVYSDHAAPAAEKVEVNVDEPQPEDVARIAKEQKILSVQEAERKRVKAIEDKKKAQQDHDQQQRCEKARNHYYNVKDSRRLYERDNDGNRVYYSDKDANAQREQARQTMLSECGS